MEALTPRAIPFDILQTASSATVCVTDAPIVEASVMRHESMIDPLLPNKFSCNGSASKVPQTPVDSHGIAIRIPNIQRWLTGGGKSLCVSMVKRNPRSFGIAYAVPLLATPTRSPEFGQHSTGIKMGQHWQGQ